MTILKTLTLFLTAIFVIFALQNIASVQVSFLLWDIELPRIIILLITFTVGFLCSTLLLLSQRVIGSKIDPNY